MNSAVISTSLLHRYRTCSGRGIAQTHQLGLFHNLSQLLPEERPCYSISCLQRLCMERAASCGMCLGCT